MAAPARAPAVPLKIVGRPDVMEVGPVLYAVRQAGPAVATYASGSVDNLFKAEGEAPAGGFDHAPGRADLAAQAETQALRASLANPDLRIILTITEGLYRIVARRSAGIARIEDLRGKRIAVFERTSAAYFADRMLAKAGIATGEVVLVPMRPREMAPALTAHKIDAIAMWEPESERALVALGDDAVTFSDPESYRELYNLNTTAQALADPTRRAQIVAFVRRLIAASRTATHEPAKIWPLLSTTSGYPVALIGASWHHHRFPAALPDDMLDVLVEEEKWLAAQAGRAARSRAKLAPLIDRSVLEEALRGR
ncbi:ABC transporter substrate-binding protein [Sphingomonas sp. HF-S4]|uniref:ABC transporter substrate-binding protein n=1 Tax=Sphingomonas agrestis TaxID=3080540 RepID=A0ABU3Y3R6_9SPHN|nr:ABC transporter substrate-binding protein [Sphingomonas sp. HF-S4]MDV3456060.1 ABC transporter substrate-binding protein [Sphingomonas sp. HF-S4]